MSDPINKPANPSEILDKAIKQHMNSPQSALERSGCVPEVKYSGPDYCKRCHGTGRVIVMMSCMPPHIYGDCPACGGRGSNQGTP